MILTSGSTIVTLKAEYLESLSLGQHTFRLNYTDGSCETVFTITNGISLEKPSTDDRPGSLLWLMLGLSVAILAAVMTMIFVKRRKETALNKE